MATDNTKVLTVDTGDAITNLKEFKKHLDDLKGTLLGLEEGTDDYRKVAEELRSGQQKLNNVMYESKKNSAALEGSYDALVVKMRDLKKEWRATTDELKRQDLGNEILKINDQLKDLDASTGNFQRNVGDYKNAFSEAFDKMLGPLGKVNGTLGNLAKDVKGMIPLIKTVNSTAITGLRGIKAAIASTGIGLLIIAVGELAANWDKVADAIFGASKEQQEYNNKLEDSKTKLAEIKTIIDKILGREEEINYQTMELQGKDTEESKILREQGKIYKERAELRAKDHNDQIEMNKLKNKELGLEKKIAYEKSRGGDPALIDYYQTQLNQTKKNIKSQQELLDKNQEVYDNSEKALKLLDKDLANHYEKVRQNSTRAGSSAANAWNKAKEAADALVETIRLSALDEYQVKEEEYKKTVALLEQYKKNGQISEEQLIESKKILTNNYEKWKEDKQKEENEKLKQEAIKAAQETAAAAINEVNNTLNQSKIDFDFSSRLGKLDLKENTGFFEGIADSFNNIFGGQDTIYEVYSQKAKQINDLFEMNKQASLDRIAVYEDELAKLPEGSEEFLEVQTKISQEKINLNNLETENFLDNLELQDEQDQKLAEARAARFQMLQTGIQATANILKQFASMQQQQIQDDVKNGKITEREAKKKFKTVKNMQYAAAVMETAQAAMGAYSALASIPYVGPALGIAAAAAAVAQGAMQIKQIQKTKFDSTGSGSVSTPDMGSITNEYTPNYVTNVQTNTELDELSNAMGNIQPVVQVVDIESGLNTAKVRDSESTY